MTTAALATWANRFKDSDLWLLLTQDAGVGVLVLSAKGDVQLCNARAAELLQIPTTASKISSSPHGELIKRQLNAAFAGPRPVLVEESNAGLPMRIVLRRADDDITNQQLVIAVVSVSMRDAAAEEDRQHYRIVPSKTTGMVSPLADLTDSELRVLRLIGEGLVTHQIAQIVGRSSKTIEWHRASLGKKLGVRTRVELARIAIQHGLVKVPGSSATLQRVADHTAPGLEAAMGPADA